MAAPAAPQGDDLTGKVTVVSHSNDGYQWVLGSGGFATVYKGQLRNSEKSASQEDLPIDVAVKIYRLQTGASPEQIKDATRRLMRESKMWIRLSHDNIQPYFGYCHKLSPVIALISPYCKHGTVMNYIKFNSADNNLRLKFVTDVVNGLAYLQSHKPHEIVHGDLKPNNILINDKGNACLCDFGSGKVLEETGYTTMLHAGASRYMAPELIPREIDAETETENEGLPFTRWSDMYAFGMSAFEIFTEQVPFASRKMDHQVVTHVHAGGKPSRASDKQARISNAMWKIMEDCWVKERERRPLAAQVLLSIGSA